MYVFLASITRSYLGPLCKQHSTHWVSQHCDMVLVQHIDNTYTTDCEFTTADAQNVQTLWISDSGFFLKWGDIIVTKMSFSSKHVNMKICSVSKKHWKTLLGCEDYTNASHSLCRNQCLLKKTKA